MNIHAFQRSSLALILGATGCSGHTTSTPNDTGPESNDTGTESSDTNTGAIEITPGSGTLLTCSTTTFSAGGPVVTWSATAGSITSGGAFTAPNVQSTTPITITAISSAATSDSASVDETAVTAIVGGPQTFQTGMTAYPEIFQHATASNANRVYAVSMWTTSTNGGPGVEIIRSNDGGISFGSPVAATPAIAAASAVDCAAVAVDPTNPDLVYVIFDFNGGSGLPPQYIPGVADSQGLGLAVSTDGAVTFPNVYLLQTGDASDPIPVAQGGCPDVVVPKPNAVAVTAPGGTNELPGGNPLSMFLWVDTNKGAGFSSVQSDAYNSIANEETGTLRNEGSISQSQDSPRLFSDGKGTLCVVYIADPSGTSGAFVQCSTDFGVTFSAPVAASEVSPSYHDFSVQIPTGTFGPNGEMVVAWQTNSAQTVNGAIVGGISISTDGGQTFTDISPVLYQWPSLPGDTQQMVDVRFDGAGVLWTAYQSYNGINSPLVVDKTCDLGKTWSGPAALNSDAAGNISNASFPSLVLTTSGMAAYAATTANGPWAMLQYTLTP